MKGHNLNLSDFELDEIISIECVGEIETIDITVEGTHMFFVNDIYTHNSGLESEFVNTYQMGGSIKKAQKTHFLMSVAKSNDQKQDNTANIQILKARFAKDGLRFENAIFNNDTLEIRCINYGNSKPAPFKANGGLDTSLDTQMRNDYLDSGLNLTIDDYDKRIENLKDNDDKKPSEDDEKKSNDDDLLDDDIEPVIV